MIKTLHGKLQPHKFHSGEFRGRQPRNSPLTTDHFCWEKILWSVNLAYSKKWKINDMKSFFFISPVFLPKTLIRWGLNPGRTGVRIISFPLVDHTIFQRLCLIRLHHLLSHISLYQVRSQLLMIISLRYLCGDPPLEQRSRRIYNRMKPNKPPVCAGSGRVNWGSSSHAEI